MSTFIFSQQIAVDLHASKLRQQELHDNVRQIKEDSHNIVSTMTKTVDKKVTMVLQDVTSQLSSMVDKFGSDNFDQQNLLPYKEVSVFIVLINHCRVVKGIV